MAKRFIKVYEQIVNWEWFKHPNTLSLFIYLLLKANYKDLDFRGRTIRRGQMLTSLTSISTGTGLSVQQARTALAHLISTGEVTDEATNQGRLITVIKYDEYQTSTGTLTGNQQAINKQPNRQSTSDLTSNLTPSIEYIEYIEQDRKIEQIDTPPLPPSLKDDFIEKSFATFWACYPKKRSKPEALRAWKKIKPDPALADEIMTGLQKWSESYDWLKENGRYIPYPATWLNNRSWEDDLPSAKKQDPVKRVAAQQYEQRDYSGVQGEMSNDFASEIERKLRAKQQKRVLAQMYDQRDYSGVQAELMAEQDREMEEFMRKQEEEKRGKGTA